MYLFQFTASSIRTPVYSFSARVKRPAYLRRVYVRPRLLLSYSEVSCAVQHRTLRSQYTVGIS